MDRPGMGLSDVKSRRTLLDWPDDVVELADALRLDRFGVLGISGGAPFAAACAFKLSERVTSTAMVCGMGPADAPGTKERASWSIPGLIGPMRSLTMKLMATGLTRDPDQFEERSMDVFSEPDRQLLARPEVAEAYVVGLQEAKLYRQPWGFDLKDITGSVHLWHGEEDANVPSL